MWIKGNTFALLVGMQTGNVTVESSMEIPQKIKNESASYPVIPLLGIYLKDTESPIQKNICTPMFIVALFTTERSGNSPSAHK